MNRRTQIAIAAATLAVAPSCAQLKSIFNPSDPASASDHRPIENPFGNYYAQGPSDANENMVLRTKKGDRSVEVQIPKADESMSDFVIPVSPAFKDEGRSPASEPGASGVDDSYKDHSPTISDREITGHLPQGLPEDSTKRNQIEQGLGLMPAEDNNLDQHDKSYLASVDHIKQLYKSARYEAALIETDELIRIYQTDPKLYEMRGTLLERMGRHDLAIQSWNQALRFEPGNQALRRFIERKQARSVASP